MRDIVDELALALESGEEESENDGTSVKDELMAMLDQYVPATGGRRSSRRTPPSRRAPQAAPPSASQPAEETVVKTDPEVSTPEPEIAVDDINWEVSADTDWDTLVSETAQGFGGLSLEQAQQHGLLAPDIVSSSPEGKQDAAPPPDQGPPVEEIDWSVSSDMDWDEIVAETDQGFGGFSLDEAQQKGIIDDLGDE